MNPWINIALSVVPEIPAIVAAILAFRKKYPSVDPAVLRELVADVTNQADTAFDDVLRRIEKDQHAGT